MNGISNKMQPVYFAAAVSVIILCAVGIAAVTGRLPGAASSPGASSPAASDPGATASGRATAQPNAFAARCVDCGVIEDIRAVQVEGQSSGLGAAAGGITGAIVGSQIGRGNGRTLATIAGAAGGAFAGNAIEKNTKKQLVYRVTLRMEDGSSRTLTQGQQPPFAVGDRVRVLNGKSLERA